MADRSVSSDAALMVTQLHADEPAARLAALRRVRALAADADSKGALCNAGAVEALVGLLSEPHSCAKACGQGTPGANDPLALAVEALSCMVADDGDSRVRKAFALLKTLDLAFLNLSAETAGTLQTLCDGELLSVVDLCSRPLQPEGWQPPAAQTSAFKRHRRCVTRLQSPGRPCRSGCGAQAASSAWWRCCAGTGAPQPCSARCWPSAC